MKSANERFTRSTLWDSSWTTMKSVIASKISIQCRFAWSMRVKRLAFSNEIAACEASTSSTATRSDVKARGVKLFSR